MLIVVAFPFLWWFMGSWIEMILRKKEENRREVEGREEAAYLHVFVFESFFFSFFFNIYSFHFLKISLFSYIKIDFSIFII